MVDCFNKLDFSDQKYKTNGTVRYYSYKGNFLFTMKNFVSFGTDHHQMLFMSTRFLKDDIDRVRVTQFQLAYICYAKHPLHKNG